MALTGDILEIKYDGRTITNKQIKKVKRLRIIIVKKSIWTGATLTK